MRVRTVRRGAALISALTVGALVLAGCAADTRVDVDAPPQVQGPLPEQTVTQLTAAMTDAMTATGSSGAIVGVWVPWSGTWVTGLGTQSPTDTTPVTTDQTFRVGDVTREMVCDALYAVAADGTVSLRDSVTKYVGGAPDLKDVTLLDLCNGTAGTGSFQQVLQPMWLANPKRVWNPREIAGFGLGQPRSGPAGQAWRDSDAGYVLLGLALSRATGLSASQLLEKSVFTPLSLEDTRLPAGDGQWAQKVDALRGNVSVKDSEGVWTCSEPLDATSVSTSTGFTDSGVVSTIHDLGRYAQALALGSLAKDDAAAKARWKDPKAPGSTSWLTTTGGAYTAGSLIGQYGSVPGYLTAAFADPGTGMTVAVVLNNSAVSGSYIAYLAWELAAIASKAPAAAGKTAPQFGLPWTAEQYHDAIQKGAICTAKPA